MSLSVVDYTGDYINKDILPKDPVLLIICEEFCLVPDNLKAVLLLNLDYSNFSTNGVYIFRIPNDFYRGITYGHIYTFSQSTKFYTARIDLLSICIPSANLVNWEMPYKSITHRAVRLEKTCETLKENTIFDQIYLESLNKFTKMFLISKFTRPNKTKSLKSQLKNLVEGIMVSYGKKSGNHIDFSADVLVDIIVNDLESAGVFICGMNIHYNDFVIDEYFGEFKCKVFMPRQKGNGECKGNGRDLKNLGSEKVGSVSENTTLEVYGSKNSSVVENQVFISRSVPVVQPKSSPCLGKEAKKKKEIMIGNFEPQPKPKSQYYPSISTPIPFINSNLSTSLDHQETKSKKVTKSDFFNTWEDHKSTLIDQVFTSIIEKQSEIDNILKLFRICNRTIRDYILENQLSIEDDKITEFIRKVTKSSAEKFFTADSPHSLSDLFARLESNGSVKLYQKIN
jgi:hypothetical protein